LSAANLTSDKLPSLQAEYQVIADNNLFRPLGWKNPPPSPQKTENPVVEVHRKRPAPTYNLSLTGIAQNGSSWLAIVEDETKKEAYFLNRGEKLKDSFVEEIFEEHIILVVGDTKTQISLGESIKYDENGQILLNTIANRIVAPKIEKSENTQSLIEQMRARRRKELGQE